jgi:hypothetical protein
MVPLPSVPGLFSTVPIYVPNDVPLSPSGQAAALAIHNALANIPNPCSAGAQATRGNTSAAASLGDAGLQGQLSYGQNSVGSVQSQTQGTALIPSPPDPLSNWVPSSPVNAQMQGRYVLSVNAGKDISIKGHSIANVNAWLNFKCE